MLAISLRFALPACQPASLPTLQFETQKESRS